jgi:hypothetical protein
MSFLICANLRAPSHIDPFDFMTTTLSIKPPKGGFIDKVGRGNYALVFGWRPCCPRLQQIAPSCLLIVRFRFSLLDATLACFNPFDSTIIIPKKKHH